MVDFTFGIRRTSGKCAACILFENVHCGYEFSIGNGAQILLNLGAPSDVKEQRLGGVRSRWQDQFYNVWASKSSGKGTKILMVKDHFVYLDVQNNTETHFKIIALESNSERDPAAGVYDDCDEPVGSVL
jgi:hypothetical protein